MKSVNILVPLAGGGSQFIKEGYSFPKPLIDIHGKTMVQLVAENLRPKLAHHFIFICMRDHYEKYDLHNIFRNATRNNFDVVTLSGKTAGAACTALCATPHIDTDDELIIANSDQLLLPPIIDAFVTSARKNKSDGHIVTFTASHPRWSFVRTDVHGHVIETAEKKVISDQATAGIYYFKTGKEFVAAAQSMLYKGIHQNNEYYICPAYNELILNKKKVTTYPIKASCVHSLGTPEDLRTFVAKVESGKVKLEK